MREMPALPVGEAVIQFNWPMIAGRRDAAGRGLAKSKVPDTGSSPP